MINRTLCSKCGADDVLSYDTPETAICPACCEDHEYVYESREHFCKHCGVNPPDDWYYSDDDVGIGFSSYPPGTPLGVLASSMNGNASQRELNPDAWDRWVEFCNACGAP